jgi:hypothetical protein
LVVFALAALLVTSMAGCGGGKNKSTNPDKTPPTVSLVEPSDAATNVAVATDIVATFSEAMASSSITSSTFTLKQGVTPVAGTVTYGANAATFDPTDSLAFGTVYTATITTGAEDVAGNNLETEYSWSFTTALAPDVTPPIVASTSPANNAVDVLVNSLITATFSEPLNAATVTASSFLLTHGATPVAGAVSYAGTTATFDPVGDLAASTVYTATITGAVTDTAGNALIAAHTWTFTTASAADVTPPTVVSTVPANAAIDVAVATNATATFSEPMNPATITTATFTLKQGVTPVAGVVSYGGTTAVFNPSSDLAPGTVYTATITTGATDLAGNAIASNYVWSFTTATPSDVTPPTVISTIPASAAIDVSVDANITATFSEAMNAASLTAATFTLAHSGTPVSGTVSYADGAAMFDPSSDLTEGTVYTATITTGATDLAGNALAANYEWSFTTHAPVDVTPPTVVSTAPVDGDTGVAGTVIITAEFSEPMDPSTFSASTFTLYDGLVPVAGTVGYTGTTASFTPSTPLLDRTHYTAAITTGATDLAGNPLASTHSWSFTTTGPPDVTPPIVAYRTPGDLATNISTGTNVTATFSEPMDASTITTETFTLTHGGTPVTGMVTYSDADSTATFAPDDKLAAGVLFVATVTTGVKDRAGNPLSIAHSWSFTTEPPPTVASTVPTNNDNSIPLGANVTATFAKAMDESSISTSTFTLKQGASDIAGTVTYSGQVAVFDPSSNLAPNTSYTATITTDVEDLHGNHMATNKVWTFMTGSSVDNTAPVVSSTTPANGATHVSMNTTVRAQFNEDMDPSTLTTATFTVTLGLAVKVGTVTYVGTTATFTPISPLASGSVYTATITTGAKDLSGNALATEKTWSFTTGP